jgi:hypothetical protein
MELGDLVLFDPDLSVVRFQERNNQLQRHALADPAAAKDAERLTRPNLK